MSEKTEYTKYVNLMGAFRRVKSALAQEDEMSDEEVIKAEAEWLEIVRSMRSVLGSSTDSLRRNRDR